ncbi:MAG: glutamate-1-semialdehyde-2,1-aminomutase [Acidobacteria bacterium]|nr:glutamate-1-semialdehyde-2,1-aminomutase [Acidobacteriota bacterium]
MPSSTSGSSRRLFARARRVLPGGVNSPVRAFKAVQGQPPFIARGTGAHIADVDGRRYIDYVMSWGPLIHGHAPAGLTKALVTATKRGTSFGAPTALEVQLAERVCSLVPSIERVRFVNSGTEATMTALRLARAATRKDKIIKFQGCYHGHADPLLVQAGSGALTLGVPTSPGVTKASAANTLVANYNDLESVKRLFRIHRRKIAAVIIEPIAGNMGVIPPQKGFLEELRELCDQSGVLLIFDEVISGFRVALGGAQTIFGVKPDLTCLGKIIGGGLPVGAYGGRADLMTHIAPDGPVYQAGTLSGNPLAMTAGTWTLSRLSERLYHQLAKLGDQLAEGLAEVASEAGVQLRVNSFGSMVTPFFTNRPVCNYRSATDANTRLYGVFFRSMLRHGIYPPPSQFESWFLSAAHEAHDIERTIDAARLAMRAVARS